MSKSLDELKKEFEEDFARDNDIVSIKHHGVKSIQNERQNDYGDAKVSHDNIAKLWTIYLERKSFSSPFDSLDATDVAVMMSLMKISRLAYKRKEDSFIDLAAYADFAMKFEENR